MTDSPDSTDEVWKPVVGFEGLYEVSNLGRVRNAIATRYRRLHRILKPTITVEGYCVVSLNRTSRADQRQFKVHQLVAAAFIGPCPAGMCVNHIDAVKMNNRAENLEYVTPLENLRHALRLGRLINGERHHKAKLTEADVRMIRELARRGEREPDLAKRFHVTHGTIWFIVRGKIWKHVT